MKRVTLILLALTSAFTINTKAVNNNHQLIFDDLNTLNFKERLSNINLNTVKKICSYDFCDYIDGSNVEGSLKSFTNKYLSRINSDEDKNIIKVKGIKITKVILNK